MSSNDSPSLACDAKDNSGSETEETGKRKRKSTGSSKKKIKCDKNWTTNVKEESVSKRQRSPRTPKPVRLFDDDEDVQPQYRSCAAKGCLEPQPRCCLQASSNCTRDGYTSRWYHMSLGEHFCNDCFDHFYRVNKAGYQEFQDWTQMWYRVSNIKPSIKLFVAESVLPYWFKCTVPGCGKWREFSMDTDPNPEFIRNFQCQTAYKRVQKNHCAIPEETCVSDLSKPDWIVQLTEIGFLKKSPASPYLKMYYPEGIGHSPSPSYPTVIKLPQYIDPFNETFNGHSTIWIRPNALEDDEEKYMPPSVIFQPMLFAIRNLIVTLWNALPRKWLTIDKVSEYLVCRGLTRIYMLKCAEKILKFLIRKGVINYGLMNPPNDYVFEPVTNESVIVIGAGISGLAVAKHLKNHNIKTVVLETKCRIGGRICDINNLPHGANIIRGLINNPLTIMCYQAGIPISEISEEIMLIYDNGDVVSDEVKERMMYQYSGIMNGALEWAKENHQDANWYDIIVRNQKEYNDQIRQFTEEENYVFNCLLQLNELEQGIPNKKLTLLAHEEPKSEGPNGEVPAGFSTILSKLAEGLNVQLNNKVTSIKFNDNQVTVETNKDTYTASKIVLTVPLSVLKNKIINFDPPLPEIKNKCMSEFECYRYEKIILQFPNKFWGSVIKDETKRFAFVSKEDIPFQLFHDITNSESSPTLQTFIAESNYHLMENKSDEELKNLCMDTLRKVFSRLEIKVPEPSNYYITRWYLDPDICAAGSFIKVNSSYSLYDTLAEDIDKKLFFAGEATFRKCPYSATGAYLSGLREAVKILDIISPLMPTVKQ